MAATPEDERRPAELQPESIRGKRVEAVVLGDAGREVLGPPVVEHEERQTDDG